MNAVAVLTWDGTEYGIDSGVVYLTNAPVKDPFVPFDAYDDRSVIENLLYRETKQGWHLERSPKRNERSMTAHAVLTMMTYALTLAYRDYMEEEEQVEERYRAFKVGTRRWRRELFTATRDHAIIFVGEHYGILHLAEFATLVGVVNTKAPAGMQSKEEIFARKGYTPG